MRSPGDRRTLMPKPPETMPHSDLEGVNRDARVGTPSKSPDPEPGSALHQAEEEGKARPKPSEPLR
jgi:hypothetical protein